MTQDTSKSLYKDAGVDIEKGEKLVEWLQSDKSKDKVAGEVVSGIGGFAALFRPDFGGMEDPLLIAGTDGVGTKVLLGIETGLLEGLGVDLVSMCVNDLYTIGGKPLFFLDYYATGILDENQFKSILKGIKKGLAESNALLLGGETAELPGLYEKGHFDLAGFVVGVVDGKKKLEPSMVEEGDVLIALEASGFHSNGYSLVRKWLKEKPVDEKMMANVMKPTKIYHEVPELLEKLGHGAVHALANITGGGISGNLPRVLPENVVCEIDAKLIPTPSWMQELCDMHDVSFADVEPVYNMGAGMVAAVAADKADEFIAISKDLGLHSVAIGKIVKGEGKAVVNYL